MKKTTLSLITLILALSFVLSACAGEGVWDSAIYKEDTTLGEGATTFYLDVTAEDKTVTITVNTDKTVLADALLELGLVDGDDSQYGLYIKVVNGITAEYENGGYYWGFNKNGETMLVGVSSETVEAGARYELIRTK